MWRKAKLCAPPWPSLPTDPTLQYKSLAGLLCVVCTAKGWSKIPGNAFPPSIFGDLRRFCCQLWKKNQKNVFWFSFSFSCGTWADSWVCTGT